MIIYCIWGHLEGQLSKRTEDAKPGRVDKQICSPSENRCFLLYSGKRNLALLESTPIFGTFPKSAHPGSTSQTIGLLTAGHSATLFAPWQIAISVLPSASTIHFYIPQRESLPSCVGYLLLPITVVSFHPLPEPPFNAVIVHCWNLPKDRNMDREQKADFLTKKCHMLTVHGASHSAEWYLQWQQIQTSRLEKNKLAEQRKSNWIWALDMWMLYIR